MRLDIEAVFKLREEAIQILRAALELRRIDHLPCCRAFGQLGCRGRGAIRS